MTKKTFKDKTMLQYSRGLHVVNGAGGEPNKTKNQQQQQNKSPSHCYTGTPMQARERK